MNWVATSIIYSMLFMGCGQPEIREKIVIQKVFVPEEKTKFEKITTVGAYIELKDHKQLVECTPALNQLRSVYTGVIDFYDWQIDEYSKGSDERNSTKPTKQ